MTSRVTRQAAMQACDDGAGALPSTQDYDSRLYASAACCGCKHWELPTGRERLEGQDKVYSYGVCTLNPAWIATHGLHFCSHFLLQGSATPGSWIWKKSNKDEQKRRIEAEKKLKTLRAKLKQAKVAGT